MLEELKKVLITDDMKEQEMTDKIVDMLKGMGYDFYYPAYSGARAQVKGI